MLLFLFWLAGSVIADPPPTAGPVPSAQVRPLSDTQLLTEVQRRAFRFFWEQADPQTGLVKDRARNNGSDDYRVASTAATGYALAALPVAVEHRWIRREEGQHRAELTLRYLVAKFPQVHGWCYHFVDMRTGERVWNSEISTIDTTLLVDGALVSGQYFHGEVERLANALYDRLDWTWARTNGGAKPDKLLVTMGWKPEAGFLPNDWDTYCELPLIYLLGIGAKRDPLPPECWAAWKRPIFQYDGLDFLMGGPIFLHEMVYAYYPFKDRRDRLGWDYWVSSTHGVKINRQFCIDHANQRKTYARDVWGLNASDGPKGYNAYGVPEPEDGTVSPTGALASILFTQDAAIEAAQTLYAKYYTKLWGRYGFGDAFNVDADWFDADVIGIDLGMALLAIEDHRSGLIWRLMTSHPSTTRAFSAIGLQPTTERQLRPLKSEWPAKK